MDKTMIPKNKHDLPKPINHIGSLFIATGIILLLLNIFVFQFGETHLDLFDENNIIENTEVIFLLLALFIFTYGILSCHTRSIAFCSFTVCFGFILRELDIEQFDVPHWIIFLGSGIGRNILLAILGILAILFFIKEMNYQKLLKLMQTNFAICIYIVFFFLVCSWIFDKGVFDFQYNLIAEELSEINAYLLILISSIIYCIEYRR